MGELRNIVERERRNRVWRGDLCVDPGTDLTLPEVRMTRRRLAATIALTALTALLAACSSPTAPSPDCSGGVVLGSNSHC